MVEKIKRLVKWILPNTHWANMSEQVLFEQTVELTKKLNVKQSRIDELERILREKEKEIHLLKELYEH